MKFSHFFGKKENILEKSLVQTDPFLRKMGVRTHEELGVSSIEDLPAKYVYSDENFASGDFGIVGKIEGGLVGKRIVNDFEENSISGFDSIPYLVAEFEKQKELYENDVKMPRIEGVYNVVNSSGEKVPSFVMEEKVGYVSLFDIEDIKERKVVEKLRDVEISKMKDIGYVPVDAKENSMNVLYNRDLGEVCIIDAGAYFKRK